MDTSDSECFESADEEFYPEDEDVSKSVRKCVVSNLEKDLTNLELADGGRELNVEENDEKLDVFRDEYSADSKKVVEMSIENNTAKILDSQDNEVNECEDTSSSDETQSQNTQLKENSISDKHLHIGEVEKICAVNVVEEEIEEKATVKESVEMHEKESIKNENITFKPELNTKHSDSEENMWDNDDWEPIVDKDVDTSKLREPDPKPTIETSEDDSMWDNDDWEPFEKIESDQSDPKEQNQLPETSWSGWGTWGVSSILTTATQGVSTLTNQVSQGLSTVLESSMGIPDPKELARQDRAQENVEEETEPQDSSSRSNIGFGFGNLVSGVTHITKFVENTGSKVITGGLDTLETIGKKTMEVLQEGDPGLKNKRALLKLDKEKPILSQILREAKEKSEEENRELQEKHYKKKLNYEILFDDYHGLVHLEALEMLSKQCDIKLQTLLENSSGAELTDLQETMDQIKELCELPDEDDDETPTFGDIKEKIEAALKEINVHITYSKLISAWEETENWLNNLKLDFCDEREIHQEALQILAQITAIAVEQFHKCGELLLIKERRSTVDEADSLVQLTTAVTSLIGLVAAKFSDKLNMKSSKTENKDSTNALITNVFFEAGNSSSYVQDAFQLLIPVLQVGAV